MAKKLNEKHDPIKRCVFCLFIINEYNTNMKRFNRGLYHCDECHQKYMRNYYYKNKDLNLKRNKLNCKKYYEKNKEALRLKRKRYYHENKYYIKARARAVYRMKKVSSEKERNRAARSAKWKSDEKYREALFTKETVNDMWQKLRRA